MKLEDAAKLAVENVFKEGITDIFPVPQELSLLRQTEFKRAVAKKVTTCIKGNSLESLDVGPIDHVLLPKGGPFDFRRCALIHPLDTIKYLALVLTIADTIEINRPTNPRHVVLSHRFKPSNGYLFNPKYNITSFKKHAAAKARQKSTNFFVTCDIANFYDRINLHRLESILLSIGIDNSRVRLINSLLLFWANRDSYGLPVGSNASRILAEAALVEVDRYLLSIGAKFCRFVDDYRLFAPNAHSAHYWLTQLIERLWAEGLTINKSKTIIEDVSSLRDDSVRDRITQTAIRLDRLRKKILQDSEQKEQTIAPQFKIIAGYGGIIPTRFRAPQSTELKKLKTSIPKEKLDRLKSHKMPSAHDITDFVKTVISTEEYKLFRELPEITDLFPQFSPYIVDVLIKYSDQIESADRDAIKNKFSRRLNTRTYLPEYITMAIVRLLGHESYKDKEILIEYFRSLRRSAGAYIGRALLDALEDHVTRGEVLEIRKYFARADSWEKRQIVRIVNLHLHDEEKRPWLKNVKTQEARDLFLVEYIKQA